MGIFRRNPLCQRNETSTMTFHFTFLAQTDKCLVIHFQMKTLIKQGGMKYEQRDQ